MTLQEFTNKYFYMLFVVTLLFGIVLYDIIGFKAMDEACGGLLLILFIRNMFHSKEWPINKFFIVTLGVFFFYFCYSIYIGSNSTKAISMDLIIQMKPYLAFFCAYQLAPQFDLKQKKTLKELCIVIWILFIPLGIAGGFNERVFDRIIDHPSCYAALITSISLVYLYCGEYTNKEKIIFLVMLSIGIASGRSKFYGFFAIAVFAIFYLGKIENLKLSIKNITACILLLGAVIFVAREKLDIYFVQGFTENPDEKDLLARFVLYATSILILQDYIPFGSGLASFGTHASAVYYSDIYTKYGIDSVWGLSKSFNKFVADTYYPSLAQFGLVGIFLFLFFWIFIIKKSIKYSLNINNPKLFTITILIIGYILIENIADASFTSNRGLFMMTFLGLIASNQKMENKQLYDNTKEEK